MGKISVNFKEIGKIQRNSNNMREIFQFVENIGKFFVQTSEILNKIYKNVNVKI